MCIYAKRAQLGQEAVNHATEIKLRAERKAGEILKVTPKNEGAKGNPGGQGAKLVQSSKDTAQTPPTLAEIGVIKKESSRFQQMTDLPAWTSNRADQLIVAQGVYNPYR